MDRLYAWGLVLIIIMSGCTTTPATTELSPTGTSIEETPDADVNTEAKPGTPTGTPSPSITETPTPEETPTPPEPPDNPWRKEPIIIGIDSSADPDRNYSAHVVDAVEYWNMNGKEDNGWSPNFTVQPESSSPDIVVRFVNEIEYCGKDDGGVTIGCARILQPDTNPNEPEIILVNLGLTNQSTYRAIRHELGHTLGLEHGEGPPGVMQAYDTYIEQVVRIYFEFETSADHEKRDTRRQARYVFDYYSSGADGFLTENVEFALIEKRDAADIIIQVNKRGGESIGYAEDDRMVIEVNGISTNRRGWHIGYWFGFYFGAKSISELPPPFDEPESDPRTQWWH